NDALAQPILYPSKLELPAEVVEFYPTKLPPLRGDAPTLLIGRMKETKSISYTVTGNLGGKEVVVKGTETVNKHEADNYFLISMLAQWKNAAAQPALIRADRALVFAYENSRMTRDQLLTAAQMALSDNKLDVAGLLYQKVQKLNPPDVEA